MESKFSKRQAVVVIHGIGEQRPMETLRGFVDTIVTETNARGQKLWNKPDRLSDSFELRKLTSPGDGVNWPRTDYFEYYWAANMRDTTVRDVLAWLVDLMRMPGKEMPVRIKWVWWWSRALVALAVVLGIVGGIAATTGRFAEFARYSWALSMLSFVGTAVLNAVFIRFIGDAARYLSPKAGNIAQRQAIRRDGVALIRRLHKSGEYGRIIVVGHSLGTVIAYDILRFVWDEYRRESPTSEWTERKAILEKMQALIDRGVEADLADAKAYAHAQGEYAAKYQELQRDLWRAERLSGGEWLVTDLVTCGSPLAHASVLLADSRDDLVRRQLERELPTCPPTTQGDEDSFAYSRKQVDAQGRPTGGVHALHASAPFACVCWTNLYFERDFIGGPVAPVFGDGVRDVLIKPDHKYGGTRKTLDYLKGYTPWAHTMYWAAPPEIPGKPKPVRWDAIRRMRGAMTVNQMRLVTFPDPPEPEATGAED